VGTAIKEPAATPCSCNFQSAGRRVAALLIAVSVLSACGGGGGGTRPTQPGPTAPPPGPPPVVETPEPEYSQHLTWTGADEAHAEGLTGAGFKIGIIDSGVSRYHPALNGRVTANLVYIDGKGNNLSVDDVAGHGTAVAQTAAGSAFGSWPGGIAPGAERNHFRADHSR